MVADQLPGRPTCRLDWSARLICAGMVASFLLISSSSSASPDESSRPVADTAAHDLASTQPAGAVNPHWSASGCGQCHETNGTIVSKLEPAMVNALCWRCHDGYQARREVHPVGRTASCDQVRLPEGWPALNGVLCCSTCHDMKMACDRQRNRPAENTVFLRSIPGTDRRSFCAACHVTTAESRLNRFNPHIMLGADGRSNPEACLYCHRSRLDTGKTWLRTGQAQLRADPIILCIGCHRRHADYFEPGHIGLLMTTVTRQWQPYVSSRTVTTRPARAQSRPADLTNPIKMELPLGVGGRIVCSTCHNPHQEGLFTADSVLADGAMRWEAGHKSKGFRGFGKDLCSVCHE